MIPAWIDTDDGRTLAPEVTEAVTADERAARDAREDVNEDTDALPEDCDCGEWNADEEFPCWPCYRDGFETPASIDEEEYRTGD